MYVGLDRENERCGLEIHFMLLERRFTKEIERGLNLDGLDGCAIS